MVRGSLEETAAAPAGQQLSPRISLKSTPSSIRMKHQKKGANLRTEAVLHSKGIKSDSQPTLRDSDEIANERNDRPDSFEDWIINQSDPRTWACALPFQAMAELAGMITTVWKQLSIDHWKRVAFAKKIEQRTTMLCKERRTSLKKTTLHTSSPTRQGYPSVSMDLRRIQ